MGVGHFKFRSSQAKRAQLLGKLPSHAPLYRNRNPNPQLLPLAKKFQAQARSMLPSNWNH